MTEDNIRRLIQNQKSEHSPHAFAGNRSGMEDFNLLYPLLSQLPSAKLRKWMRLIDAMRATHSGCGPCTAKILAYSILFTENHSPTLCQHYCGLYTAFVARHFYGKHARDIMAEVLASLHGTDHEDEAEEDTSTNSLASNSEFLAHMEDEDDDRGQWKAR